MYYETESDKIKKRRSLYPLLVPRFIGSGIALPVRNEQIQKPTPYDADIRNTLVGVYEYP